MSSTPRRARFKQILKTMQRSDKEVNFEEAVGSAYKAWAPYAMAVKPELRFS